MGLLFSMEHASSTSCDGVRFHAAEIDNFRALSENFGAQIP